MTRIITTAVLCFLCHTILSAQDTLVYGDNIQREIVTLGESHLYQFDAHQGDIIWLRMRDVTAIDAHIQIVDSFGLILEEDFDLGGLAEIKEFIAPDTATYFIRAFDHNHNDIGHYGLSLHKINGPSYSKELDSHINFTDSIRTSAAINVYHFHIDSGDIISAQMRALTSHLEPEFYVFDEKGNRIAKSKRKGRRALVEQKFTETGKYTLILLDRGGNDSDQIGFSLLKLNRQESISSISCGITAQNTIHHLAERNPYLLHMSAGEVGLLQMRSPNPKVEIAYEIYDESGNLIHKDDGSDRMIGTTLNAEKDQTFMVLVFDKHGNDLGPYGVHYESITQNICAQNILCEEENEFIHDIDAVAHLNTYRINGVNGEAFSFLIEELDKKLEPQIRLCDDQGEIIMEKSSTRKIEVDGVFPSTGYYYLLVGDRSGNDTGQYYLSSLSHSPKVHLPDTIVVNRLPGCVTLRPTSPHLIANYSWNNGEDSPILEICPESSYNIKLDVLFESGCTASDSTYLKLEVPRCDVIDFNQFQSGEVPNDLDIVHIYSDNNDGPNLATIFDSSNPPQHSDDLGTPNEDFNGPGKGKGGEQGEEGENNQHLEKILIVVDDNFDENEDGLIDDPRPDHNGGFLFFEFHQDVFLKSIDLLNITKNGGQLFFWNRAGKMLDKIDITRLGSNSFQTVDIKKDSVARMKIHMNGTGAVDNIAYCISGNESTALVSTPTTRETKSQSKSNLDQGKNNMKSDPNKVNSIDDPEFLIFPNPSTEYFKIHFQNRFEEPLEISLFNLSGEFLQSIKLQTGSKLATMYLDKSTHSPGVYLVELKSSTVNINRKIVIR